MLLLQERMIQRENRLQKIIFKRIQFVRMINFNGPSKALKKKIEKKFQDAIQHSLLLIMKNVGFNNCFCECF